MQRNVTLGLFRNCLGGPRIPVAMSIVDTGP
jgi:hypothetical protein